MPSTCQDARRPAAERFVTRYDDVSAVPRDRRSGNAPSRVPGRRTR